MNEHEEILDEFAAKLDSLSEIGAAVSYHESCSEKYESMSAYFADRGELTDAQFTAIENMIAGIDRWLERRP